MVTRVITDHNMHVSLLYADLFMCVTWLASKKGENTKKKNDYITGKKICKVPEKHNLTINNHLVCSRLQTTKKRAVKKVPGKHNITVPTC